MKRKVTEVIKSEQNITLLIGKKIFNQNGIFCYSIDAILPGPGCGCGTEEVLNTERFHHMGLGIQDPLLGPGVSSLCVLTGLGCLVETDAT